MLVADSYNNRIVLRLHFCVNIEGLGIELGSKRNEPRHWKGLNTKSIVWMYMTLLEGIQLGQLPILCLDVHTVKLGIHPSSSPSLHHSLHCRPLLACKVNFISCLLFSPTKVTVRADGDPNRGCRTRGRCYQGGVHGKRPAMEWRRGMGGVEQRHWPWGRREWRGHRPLERKYEAQTTRKKIWGTNHEEEENEGGTKHEKEEKGALAMGD